MTIKSIRRELLKWQIGALLVTGLLASIITYALVWNAFNHLRDYGLVQIANSIVRHGIVSNDNQEDDKPDNGQFISQIWDGDHELQYSSLDDGGPPRQSPGHHTLIWHGEKWHIYTLEDSGLTIQVANTSAGHYTLFRRIVPWLLLPLIFMIALLGGLIWFVVGHVLRPLQQVRAEILRQKIPDLHQLVVENLPEEVAPLGDALNTLLQRLDQAFAKERNFIADAAHELRSPLTALKLQAQLATQANDAGKSAMALEKMLAGVNRVSHLVEQLLQMARLEPDAGQFPFETVRLDLLAKQVIVDFLPLAEAREIDLGIGKCRAVEISGHTDSLQIMLANLIDNALRYTPVGGCVDVDIDVVDNQVILSVADTGPGIPASARERVFDRFFRLADASIPGSGLGLAIVKQVAQLHAGEIVLDDAIGGGLIARFIMSVQSSNLYSPCSLT